MGERLKPRDLPRLPKLNDAARYHGLYIIDFGDSVSVGYTAGEVATLHQSGRFERMSVYRIHRALSDGTLELVGIARERFGPRPDDGFLFLRRQEQTARADFEALKELMASSPSSSPSSGEGNDNTSVG